VTFYRLILLIDIFICLIVTAVCLFFIKVLQQQQQLQKKTTLYAHCGRKKTKKNKKEKTRYKHLDKPVSTMSSSLYTYHSY